jgi:hypothetical protein
MKNGFTLADVVTLDLENQHLKRHLTDLVAKVKEQDAILNLYRNLIKDAQTAANAALDQRNEALLQLELLKTPMVAKDTEDARVHRVEFNQPIEVSSGGRLVLNFNYTFNHK